MMKSLKNIKSNISTLVNWKNQNTMLHEDKLLENMIKVFSNDSVSIYKIHTRVAMNSGSITKIKNEKLLIAIILLISICIRFFQLDKIPLNDAEARLALNALNLRKGTYSELAAQPLYLALTSLFFIFSVSNFTARLFPAFIGSVFVITPFLFKKWIGIKSAMILSMLLTFDPLLISISRQADSRILALFFLIVSVALILFSKKTLAGIASALLLLSGGYAWHLAVVLILQHY